jgi:diguanylate cyclase (GGDEF)-like protein
MRLVGRHDVYWLVVITIAVFAIFSRPLGTLLDYAHDLDRARGLQLMPGLVVLTGAFFFHQFRKRQEMRAKASAAVAEARLATERAVEMERLVTFGQALARSLDRASIRSATTEHLPKLAGGRGAWALMRTSGGWLPLTDGGEAGGRQRERAAARAIGEADADIGITVGDVCLPLVVAGKPVGVIGVSAEPPLTEVQRSALIAAAALLAVQVKNAELFQEVRENSVRDGLTGCFNRKAAIEVMDAELRRARRSQMPVSMVMFDLDFFKDVNDKHGHLCGDAVLAAVGSRMNAVLRGSDLKCRYGGEEFLILLPDTPLAGARRVAETLRRDLEEHPVQWHEEMVVVTGSFGITGITPGEVDTKIIIGRADAALYRAKEAGRNCIRVAEEQEAIV